MTRRATRTFRRICTPPSSEAKSVACLSMAGRPRGKCIRGSDAADADAARAAKPRVGVKLLRSDDGRFRVAHTGVKAPARGLPERQVVAFCAQLLGDDDRFVVLHLQLLLQLAPRIEPVDGRLNPHLEQFGICEIGAVEYDQRLQAALAHPRNWRTESGRFGGFS